MSVKYLKPEEFQREKKTLQARRPREAGTYENWKRFHDVLCSVAKAHGRVSDYPDPTPDFYYSGDWFHELTDGFALFTTKGLSVESLRELQKVVAGHHRVASLSLGGEVTTALFGLHVLITSSDVFISWRNESAEGCRANLEALGVRL